MTNTITADGEWAYQGNPQERVQIAIVDGGADYEVVSMASGRPLTHNNAGTCLDNLAANMSRYNLVPLQEARECWVVFYDDGVYNVYDYEATAISMANNHGGKVVRVVRPD